MCITEQLHYSMASCIHSSRTLQLRAAYLGQEQLGAGVHECGGHLHEAPHAWPVALLVPLHQRVPIIRLV